MSVKRGNKLTREQYEGRARACREAANYLDRLTTGGHFAMSGRWFVILKLLALAKELQDKADAAPTESDIGGIVP